MTVGSGIGEYYHGGTFMILLRRGTQLLRET